jgi:alpha-glucosidase
MIGRYRDLDLGGAVAQEVRAAVTDARHDALLIAEHGHDARSDLQGGGWQGTMNYSGFARPVWCWLRAPELSAELRKEGFLGLPVEIPRLGGNEVVRTMRAFRAGVPWASTLHSWVLLDSHDTARFRSVAGSRELQLVGIGLQMTTPGVPMVFAGDELGLEGAWGEDARRTMPWDRPETWDANLLDAYRRLIELRRGSKALACGGIRYAAVGDDAIAYLREVADERLLCLAARARHEAVRLSLAALGCAGLETLYGADAGFVNGEAVLPADGPAFHVWRLA